MPIPVKPDAGKKGNAVWRGGVIKRGTIEEGLPKKKERCMQKTKKQIKRKIKGKRINGAGRGKRR